MSLAQQAAELTSLMHALIGSPCGNCTLALDNTTFDDSGLLWRLCAALRLIQRLEI
jgi:hypothetical protein